MNTGEYLQLLKLERPVKGGKRSLHTRMTGHLQSIRMMILQVIIAETQTMKGLCGATQLIQVYGGRNALRVSSMLLAPTTSQQVLIFALVTLDTNQHRTQNL